MKQSAYVLLALVFLVASSVVIPRPAFASVSGQVATPTATPPSGSTVADNSTVTLADSTVGALIFYTTDGSTPSIGGQSTLIDPSPVPVTISGPVGSQVTVEAFALSDALGQSATATFTYTIEPQAATPTATPTATPAGGSTVADGSTVTLADATVGAAVYYTTDGTTPTTSSPSGTSVTITGTAGSQVVVEAFATAAGYADSAVATFSYTTSSPPVHRAPPPPPCITTADLPADFTLVSCVASLPGAGGISYNTAKTSGQPSERLVVYRIEDGVAKHYLPTTISANEAEVLDAPAGTYAVLLSTRTYTDMAQEPQDLRQVVDLLTAAGATWGFQDGTFQPDADATQGQVTQMVDIVLGLPVSAPPANAAAWATPYVEALNSALGQTPYMVLSPANSGAPMTQGQFAAVLAQALHLVTGPVTEEAASTVLAKADLFSVTDAAAPITRGQVCEVLATWITAQAPPAP